MGSPTRSSAPSTGTRTSSSFATRAPTPPGTAFPSRSATSLETAESGSPRSPKWRAEAGQIVQLTFGQGVTNNEAEYDTLIAALEAVRAHYRHAIIECERAEGADFFLGELAGVEGDEATLHYIQVNGMRESGLTRVPLDDITLVRFDERYVNLFGRYALGEDHH